MIPLHIDGASCPMCNKCCLDTNPLQCKHYLSFEYQYEPVQDVCWDLEYSFDTKQQTQIRLRVKAPKDQTLPLRSRIG